MKRFVLLLGLCVLLNHVSLLAGDEWPASKPPALLNFDAFQQPEDAKAEAVLSQKTEFVFIDTPLEDVVQFVSDLHDIEIRVNEKALDEVELSVDTPITHNLNGISLRSALRLVLSELDLTYYLEQGTVVITTLEDSESQVTAEFFKLQPMLANPHVRLEQLSTYIRSLIAPDSWDVVGGPGTLCSVAKVGLVLQQTQQNRRAVVRFLTVYNQLLTPHKSAVTDIAPVRRPRIQAALGQRLDRIDFIDTPLEEAMDFLKQVLEIPIQIDSRALEDVGLDTGEPINITLAKGHTARYVIDTILKQKELVAIDHHGTLFITTPEVNETMLSLRAYSMNGLSSANEEGEDSMVALVSTSVHADSWDGVGGPGQIMQDQATNSLFVLQTQETHRAIADLLDQMRPEGTFDKIKKDTDKPAKLLSTKPRGNDNPFGGEKSDAPDPFGTGDDKVEPIKGDGNDDPFASDEKEEAFYEVEVVLDVEDSEEEDEDGDYERGSKRKKRRAKKEDENYGEGGFDGAEYGEEAYDGGYGGGYGDEGGGYGMGPVRKKGTQEVRVLFLYDTNPLMGFMPITDPKVLNDLQELVNDVVLSNTSGKFRHHNGRIILIGPKSSADKVEAFLKKLKYEPSPQFKQMQGYPGGYGGGMGCGGQGGGGGFFNVAD